MIGDCCLHCVHSELKQALIGLDCVCEYHGVVNGFGDVCEKYENKYDELGREIKKVK